MVTRKRSLRRSDETTGASERTDTLGPPPPPLAQGPEVRHHRLSSEQVKDTKVRIALLELVHRLLDAFARRRAVVVQHHDAARDHPPAEEVEAESRNRIHVHVEM